MADDDKIGHNGGPEMVDWSEYGGFVVEARDSRTHPVIGYGQPVEPQDPSRGSYSRNEAWRDLLHECRYKAGKVYNGGVQMMLRRGQLLGATAWLAHRWNWSPKTVKVFLTRLEREGMIEQVTPGTQYTNRETSQNADHVLNGSNKGQQKGQQKGKQARVITICNYDRFNLNPHGQWPAEGTATGAMEGQQGDSKGPARGHIYKKETKEQESSGLKNTRERASEPAVAVTVYEGVAVEIFQDEFDDFKQACPLLGDEKINWIIRDAEKAIYAKTRAGEIWSRDRRIAYIKAAIVKQNREMEAAKAAADRHFQDRMNAHDPDCHFEGHKIVVSNGFKSELLAIVGGDEVRLRDMLVKAAPSVELSLRGVALKKAVHGAFQRQVDFEKTLAKGKATAPPINADGHTPEEARRLARYRGEIR
jgi:hypothetical protein